MNAAIAKGPHLKLPDIKRHSAAVLGLTKKDMDDCRGSFRVSHARQIAMAVARKFSTLSTPEIGRRFGGRNHTTVLHACRMVALRCARSAEFATRVSMVCAVLEIELHAHAIARLNIAPRFAGLLPPPPAKPRPPVARAMGPFPLPRVRQQPMPITDIPPFIGRIATAVLHPGTVMVVPRGNAPCQSRKVFS